MRELTQQEVKAFDGLNQSYIEMEDRIMKNAPVCHFKPMTYDFDENNQIYWECNHCGHVKEGE